MASMLSLLDVLPRHERIDIGSGQIDVFGISGEDLGEILRRFPNAFQEIADSGGQPIKMNPELMAALMAASLRNGDITKSCLGDPVVEGRCRTLDASSQSKWLKLIGPMTFQDGVGPFLDDLVTMSETVLQVMELVVAAASKVPATTSPPTPKPSEPPTPPASGS
jgi:hypothetical protein